MGYSRAGFTEIVGVDNKAQPRYPFEFIQADALEYLAEHGQGFDAIHASPPCQGYSIMQNLPWLRNNEYPYLIQPVIEMLEGLGKPYVVENVMGARHGAPGLERRGLEAHGMKAGWLCGGMFNLPFYRHRLFATNWFWLQPGHPKHVGTIFASRQLQDRANTVVHSLATWQGNGAQASGVGVGHAKGWRKAAEAMGIDWMKREELTQAIPPAYTEYVGKALLVRGLVNGHRRQTASPKPALRGPEGPMPGLSVRQV